MGFLRAAADASAKLVKLGEAEALGVLDDHDGGVGDVDADFDDGGGDENLRFVFAEALHGFVFFVAGEAAVQETDLELWKNVAREALVFLHGGFQLELRFLDDGIDDVTLVSGSDFTAEGFPDAGEMLLGGQARGDRSAAGRELVENGNVEVAVKSERERTRDGRRREDEDMRGVAVGGGFVHEALALEDAEAVLLVNGDEAEAGEFDIVFDEGVRADDELGFAGPDAIEDGGFLRGFQAADEEFDVIAGFGEDAARGKEMLDGENFRGGHEGSLRAVFDGDHGGLERDDGFAAPDIALEETIHRGGLLEVGGDFGENAFLRDGGLERKDALEGFADGVFAEAEGDGVFFASGFALERETELVKEKFLENEALLRGRAKRVEGVERFAGFGKVRVDDGFGVRGIAEAGAQCFRQNVGHSMINKLDGRVHGATNLLGTERADGFVNGNDAADFGGVEFLATEEFNLRIDHLEAHWAELVDFSFAVKDELLAGLEASFEIAAVKELAGEQTAGFVLDEKMVDGVAAAAHAADGLATHHARANGVDTVGLDVFHFGKMDAVFVAEGQIAEEILERVDAALREEFGALRANAFDHANFGAEVHRQWQACTE